MSEIYNDGTADVFRKEYIFYQARGIAERLSSDLAQLSGFFAGAEFMSVFKLHNFIGGMLGQNGIETINSTALSWYIYKTLGQEKFKATAPDTAVYYASDDRRRMQLAEKLAASFSAYMEYQPELLKNWENDIVGNENPHEKWQALLWKILLETFDHFAQTWSSAGSLNHILQHEAKGEFLRKKLPRLFLYGISMLSEQLMESLKILDSAGIKVYLFLYNPLFSKEVNSINIEYFGKIAKDNDWLLQKHFPALAAEILSNGFIKDSDLNNLKNRLLNADDKADPIKPKKDGSLSIHSCYTAVRELEALYHHLLYLNSKDPSNPLQPKDVLVLLPDFELYSPFISSVFESGDFVFEFPYSIEKQQYVSSDSAATLLDSLLDFEARNFTSDQVLKLLENKSLSESMGIFDTEKLYEMLNEANICRVYKGSGAAENETYMVGFDYGLQRIAYGFALGEDIAYSSDGLSFDAPLGQEIFPVDIIEGSQELILFSKFRYLCDCLHEMLENRKANKTLQEWAHYMKHHIMDAFIYPGRAVEKDDDESEESEDSDEESAKRYFDTVLDNFMLSISIEYYDEQISFEVFRVLFKSYFGNVDVKRGSYKGGISFAEYQSAQGLDYKFVAILGLNYDSLPRLRKMPYFHIEEKNARGRLNLKEQDKYTFLQSILGAGEYLYLSYIGRSSRDNSKKPASVLLDIVLDCFAQEHEHPEAKSSFRIQHPLHSFSSNYNRTEYPMLKQYSIRNEKENEIAYTDERAEKRLPDTVSLDRLIAFIKNPFKHYFNNALGIYLREEESSLKEIELLGEPDNLIAHNLKTIFMEAENDELSSIISQNKHLGILPLSLSGKKKMDAIAADYAGIKKRYDQLKSNNVKEQLNIALYFDNLQLKGTLKTYGDKQILYCTSKKDFEAKYIVEAWIRHLFAVASGNAVDTYLLKQENNDILFDANCIRSEDAKAILKKLTDWYIQGFSKLYSYMPEYESTKDYNKYVYDNDYQDAYFALAFSYKMTDLSIMMQDTALFSDCILNKITDLQSIINHE
jgi:exodeoxyribonuclease V gamma subunit